MPTVTSAPGLFTSINEVEAPEGSLLQADNCVIRNKGIIEPRRGIYKNSYNYGSINNPQASKQGFFYQDTLHVVYNTTSGTPASKIAYDTGSAFTDYNDPALVVTSFYGADEALLRMKTAVFRNNLYFAALQGIYKISNVGSVPRYSGVPQSLGYNTYYTGNVGTSGSVTRVGSTVNVSTLSSNFITGEVVFCTSSDANFPSGSKTITSRVNNLFTYTEAGAAATSAAAISYESQPLIDATGFLADGYQCAYRFVLDLPDNNQQILLGPPSDKFVVANVSGTVGWVTGQSKNVQLRIQLPAGLPSNARLWVYRSEQVLTSIPVSEEMYKIYERALSSQDLSRRVVLIKDIVLDSLLTEVLYTAPSAETSLAANYEPPYAKDIASWSNRLWFANTKGVYNKSIRIVGELPDGCQFRITEFGSSTITNTFIGSTNKIFNTFFIPTTGSTSTRLRETALNLVNLINMNLSTTAGVYAFYDEDEDTGIGFIRIESTTNTPFTIAYLPPSSAGATRSFIDPILPLRTYASDTPFSYVGTTLTRASNIVTAAVSNHAFIVGDSITISAAVNTSFNGTFTVTSTTTNTLTWAQTDANASTTGTVSFSGPFTEGAAEQETNVNRVFYSKLQQGEAVPLLNYMDIGAPGKQILRIVPLRERLYVFKEDGIYTVAGEFPFRVDLLDDTAKLLAADTCAIVGNQIFCLTSQGVVSVGESGVSIVSRPWETDLFIKIQEQLYNRERFGTDSLSQSWGCGYESDRNYIFQIGGNSFLNPMYVYNYLNKVWTVWARGQKWGALHPVKDKLYFGNPSTTTIDIERKTRADFSCDYCDNKVTTTIVSTSGDDGTGRPNVMTVTGGTWPDAGDIIFVDNSEYPTGATELVDAVNAYPQLNEVVVAVVTSRNNNTINFEYIGGTDVIGGFGSAVSSTLYVYQKYAVTLKWNALNAGAPAIVKQFEEWSPIFNVRTFRDATVSFGADSQSNNDVTNVVTASPFFNDGRTKQELSTLRINPISKRVAVPRNQQRCTNLTVTFSVNEACAYWRLLGYNYEAQGVSPLTGRKK